MKTSPLYTLNLQDAVKGLVVAIGGGVISAIQAGLNAGSFAINWKQVGATALAAGLAYLGKNFFTPSKIVHHDAAE
jgi:hypothetical protein